MVCYYNVSSACRFEWASDQHALILIFLNLGFLLYLKDWIKLYVMESLSSEENMPKYTLRKARKKLSDTSLKTGADFSWFRRPVGERAMSTSSPQN